jgi:hypothetical protein
MAIGSRVTIKEAIRCDSDSSGFSCRHLQVIDQNFYWALRWATFLAYFPPSIYLRGDGYTEIDGRDYHGRQMKNLKASIPIEWLNFYAWACGALLPLVANLSSLELKGDEVGVSVYWGGDSDLIRVFLGLIPIRHQCQCWVLAQSIGYVSFRMRTACFKAALRCLCHKTINGTKRRLCAPARNRRAPAAWFRQRCAGGWWWTRG